MHPLFPKADKLSHDVIKGPGLLESIYEKCMTRELELRNLPCTHQRAIQIEFKGYTFEERLRFNLLIDNCLLIKLKSVEHLHPIHEAQLLSCMKLLNIPLGL